MMEFLFRPGQGSTIGPILWLLCFILIHRSLSPTAPKLELKSVNKDWVVESRGEAFVDDTSLGCNEPTTSSMLAEPEEVVLLQRLQHSPRNGRNCYSALVELSTFRNASGF
jgi:hypothetical protein